MSRAALTARLARYAIARRVLGILILITATAAIAAIGAALGHSFPVRAGLAVAGVASFPLIERILK